MILVMVPIAHTEKIVLHSSNTKRRPLKVSKELHARLSFSMASPEAEHGAKVLPQMSQKDRAFSGIES